MSKSLKDIANDLINRDKKVQLIYAFNGIGKTLLSQEFKDLVVSQNPKNEESEEAKIKILYYNAFTEDLFYWDNDLDCDKYRRIIIQSNNFTDWVLKVQGQDSNIIKNFQRYTSNKLTPVFNAQFNEITFYNTGSNDEKPKKIKISKGEESCLIWCIFYSLLEQIVEVLNEPEPELDQYNDLKYIFIDDPVSSLDDNHLIELAVDIADLVKSSPSDLHYVITTHNPLFYNVLYNEFKISDKNCGYKSKDSEKSRLDKLDDGSYLLKESNDSPFSYHLFLLDKLEKAITSGEVQKYHFNFLRNILEKTATFLGFNKWNELLPQESQESYYNRIINLSSHSKYCGEETSFIKEDDKRVLKYLVEYIIEECHFKLSNKEENERQ